MILLLRGTAAGQPFLMSDGVGVGYGARPDADGIDAVYFVAQENYPVEFLELGYPVRLLRYGIVPDSGGPGRYRGGCGIIREYEILADEAVLAMRIDSVQNPPWGVAGGMGGGSGRAVVNPGAPNERILAPLSPTATSSAPATSSASKPAAAAATATPTTEPPKQSSPTCRTASSHPPPPCATTAWSSTNTASTTPPPPPAAKPAPTPAPSTAAPMSTS